MKNIKLLLFAVIGGLSLVLGSTSCYELLGSHGGHPGAGGGNRGGSGFSPGRGASRMRNGHMEYWEDNKGRFVHHRSLCPACN